MAQQAPARTKIPTNPHNRPCAAAAASQAKSSRPTAPGRMLASGTGRAATRGGGPVIELECGITVYPAREEQGRWRAVWHENGERQQCEAASEEKLAAKLAKVTERLEADAPNMTLRGADLIAFYLSADRLPVQRQWSRKHAHTQRRLCERFAAPVIGAVLCQDITTGHMQQIVNAAPTPGEGGRVRGMISALVAAGLEGGYLASSRLAKVHWQAGDRPLPPPRASVAGESALWVDPAEVPADADVAGLGQALAAGRHGDRDELMAVTAAYSGLRWGELACLTIAQVDPAARVISVDRKVVEVAGHLYVEAPKNRKYRRTIYPRRTPAGYPLAERLAARLEQARAEQAAGANPLGLVFPSPTGKHWRSSNFNRNVLQRAYLAAGWRDAAGTAGGPGTACGTCSAPPPCSPGSSTPPTCPAWPATPTTASPWTCTSAPPPVSWTAPAPPPNNRSPGLVRPGGAEPDQRGLPRDLEGICDRCGEGIGESGPTEAAGWQRSGAPDWSVRSYRRNRVRLPAPVQLSISPGLISVLLPGHWVARVFRSVSGRRGLGGGFGPLGSDLARVGPVAFGRVLIAPGRYVELDEGQGALPRPGRPRRARHRVRQDPHRPGRRPPL